MMEYTKTIAAMLVLAVAFAAGLYWVESLIAAEADPIDQRKMQASFNASTWKSDDPFVLKVWALANKPESELKTLFIHAATL